MAKRRQKLVRFWVEQTPDGFIAYSGVFDPKTGEITGKGKTGHKAVLDCIAKIVALEDRVVQAAPGESEAD